MKIKKYWFLIPTIIIPLALGIYAYGQDNAKRDAKIDTNKIHIEKVEVVLKDQTGKLNKLETNDAVQAEFYKLLKPDLWARAEETVKNNNENGDNVVEYSTDSLPTR